MNKPHRLDASINELRSEYKHQIELGNTKRAKVIEKMFYELLWMRSTELRDLKTN